MSRIKQTTLHPKRAQLLVRARATKEYRSCTNHAQRASFLKEEYGFSRKELLLAKEVTLSSWRHMRHAVAHHRVVGHIGRPRLLSPTAEQILSSSVTDSYEKNETMTVAALTQMVCTYLSFALNLDSIILRPN